MVQEPKIDQRIIGKIQKLLNLKEGAEAVGSFHEAENAASRLQEMLMKHNLDLDMVKASTIQKKIAISNNHYDLSDKVDKKESTWVPKLFAAIADNNLCKAWADDKGVRIVGHEDTVQMVMYIAEQMISKIRIAERQAWKLYDTASDPWEREKRGTFRRGFLLGCVRGIEKRLREEKEAMSRVENPYAVMIVSREREIKEFLYGPEPTQEEKDKASADLAAYRNKRRELRNMADSKLHLLSDRVKEYVLGRDNEELEELLMLEGDEFAQAAKDAYKSRTRYGYSRSSGQSRSGRVSSRDGYSMGKEAGQNMSINKGINGSQPKGNIQ